MIERLKRLSVPGLLAAFGLLLAACSDVTIINETDRPVTVFYWLPDKESMSSANLPPGESFAAFTEYGGSYAVDVVQSEAYNQQLQEVRDDLNNRLFGPSIINAEEASDLAGGLHVVETVIQRNTPVLDACSANIADFTSLTVSIRLDTSGEQEEFVLICPTMTPSDSAFSDLLFSDS